MIGSYPRGTHANRSEPFALSTPTLAGIKPEPGDDFEIALLHDR
jgi:hypothetical protein